MGKGKEISEDLRWVVIRMASLLPIQTITIYTNISHRQVLRILSCYRRTGQVFELDRTLKTGRKHHLSDVELAVCRRSRSPSLALISSMQFLQNEVKQSCDSYLDELRKELEGVTGNKVSDSTIWRALRGSGYTMKKVSTICFKFDDFANRRPQLTKIAIERNELKREDFRQHMALTYIPDQLVFVDESACDRRTTYRGCAWAIKGQRAVWKAFFVRGKRCVMKYFR